MFLYNFDMNLLFGIRAKSNKDSYDVKDVLEFKNDTPMLELLGITPECDYAQLDKDYFDLVLIKLESKKLWFDLFLNGDPLFDENKEQILDEFDSWCFALLEKYADDQESNFIDFCKLWEKRHEIVDYLNDGNYDVILWSSY